MHHNGWNVDLAMKRPKPAFFATPETKERFIKECRVWIDLGLHPNIVSCYYVRDIGGTPSIFSEWMENGSLGDRIADESLYQGSEAEQHKRLLDIAIQFARGLHYAHEQGLIHQDVKPDNLMLTSGWDAKVSDFGIANARAQLTVLEVEVPDGGTIVSASGARSPHYCSMEQMDGKTLTRRTDIYSWAVSVLEMYLGCKPWAGASYDTGPMAGLNCREYFEQARIPMPQKLKELLAKCLASEPENRPHDFGIVEETLQGIYRESFGRNYARPASSAAADSAESLNNRALSFLDLGEKAEARELWKKALEQNSACPEAVFNYAVNEWQEGRTDDLAALNAVSALPDPEARIKLGRKLAALRGIPAEDDEAVFSVLTAAQPEHVLSEEVLFYDIWGCMCQTFEKSGITCLIGKNRNTPQQVANVGPDGRIRFSFGLDAPFETSLKPCEDESGFFGKNSSGIAFYSLADGNSKQVYQSGNVTSVCSGLTRNEYYMGLDKAIWFCTVEPATKTLIYKGEYSCLNLNLSRDGRRLAWSEGPDGWKFLHVLDTENGAVLWKRSVGEHPEAMAFSRDDLLFAAYDKHLMAFDSIGTPVMIYPIDNDTHSICFSRDGGLAVTGHDNGIVRLWDINRRICACSMKAGYSAVRPFFTVDPDGNRAIGVYTTYRNLTTRVFNNRLVLVSFPTPCTEAALELSRFRDTGLQLQIDEQFEMAISQAKAFLAAGKMSEAVNALESARSLEGKRFAPDCVRIYRAIASNQELQQLRGFRFLKSFDKMTSFYLSDDGAFLMDGSFRANYIWPVDSASPISFVKTRPDDGRFIGSKAVYIYRLGFKGKEDLLMDVMSLPDGKLEKTVLLTKHPGASSVSSSLYATVGGSRFLAHCSGFWKHSFLTIDSQSFEVSKTKLSPSWLNLPVCLPDGRIVDISGVTLPDGKTVPFKTPTSIGNILRKVWVSSFADSKHGICGLLSGKARDTSSKNAKDVQAFQNTLVLYSLSDGSYLKSFALGKGKYYVQNGTWLTRTDETGILLYRVADFLKEEAPQPLRIDVPGAKTCTFSADMLRIAVLTDVGVSVYELEWELEK
ncbi:MAG: protein kinase [Clostridia bacterium]|nr:protein kinase [Clostridia bacterium]